MPQALEQPRIVALELQTHILPELCAFYAETLKLPTTSHDHEACVVQAGGTRITFRATSDGSQPYYHVAFNIPENKLAAAKAWLEQRVSLLRHAETGDDVVFFEAWNAHALFFYDPAGSLLELIARHTLANATTGPFTSADILYVSEIALRGPSQEQTAARLRETFGLTHYQGQLSFLGDERGLLIASPPDRLWIPEFKKRGGTFPTQVTLAGHGTASLAFPDAPFVVTSD
ncbi:MAG: glyoxalase/bleomycin resistance/dioxygenase family protein [Chloroflexi bacterium]|nr:MAG: glyoxalase/bleomycin resistance/dioxygenase family protein [Chloroflexota bacterium]